MSEDRRKEERRNPQFVDREVGHRRDQRREGKDRRKDKRVEVELWVEEVEGRDSVFRQAGNLSGGGVFFDKALPHPVGDRLNLRIPLGHGEDAPTVKVWGEVVSDGGSKLGMGVKFLAFREGDEDKLRQFLQVVEGD